MKTRFVSLAAVAALVVATTAAVAAQPRIPGPPAPVRPPGPVQPPVPHDPPSPGGPIRNSRNSVTVYMGTSRSVVATIENRGSTYQVLGGGGVVMTKRGNRVYDGIRLTLNSVIYTVMGGSIIPGLSTNPRNASCTLRGERVFKGLSSQLSDVRFTFKRLGAQARMYDGSSVGSLANVHFSIDGRLNRDTETLVAILGGC